MANTTNATRTDEERPDTNVGTAIKKAQATANWLKTLKPDRPRHYVYVITDAERGAVKIGITMNPLQRACDLQVGNPCQLSVYQYFEVFSVNRARQIELLAHKALSAQRLIGEWFNIVPSVACETIRRVAKGSVSCQPQVEEPPEADEEYAA